MDFPVLRSRAVVMMQTASFPIPPVRRAASVESLKLAQSEAELVEIFLDLVSGSPYLPDEQKTGLAHLVLQAQWSELATQAGCDVSGERLKRAANQVNDPVCQHEAFRDMALLVFRHSRKFALLDVPRKRALGSAILAARSKEELQNVFFQTLPNAVTLNEDAKAKAANDVLEGRFYRLLLPDRLDCDELPRQHSVDPSAPPAQDEEEEECAICLEHLSASQSRLPCGHSFCTACIDGWLNGTFVPSGRSVHRSCPMCRHDVPSSAVVPPTTTATTRQPTRSRRWFLGGSHLLPQATAVPIAEPVPQPSRSSAWRRQEPRQQAAGTAEM